MSSLTEVLKNLRRSGKYCDLTIRCGEKAFKVHRAIICPQSEKLEKEIVSHFRHFPETVDDELDISGEGTRAVEAMIDYLYTEEYPLQKRASDPTDFVFHTRVFLIAEKYEMEGLSTLAKKKLVSGAFSGDVIGNTDKFLEAVQMKFEDHPGGEDLRDCHVECAAKMVEVLMNALAFVEYLKLNGEFAVALLRRVLRSREKRRGEEIPESEQSTQKRQRQDSSPSYTMELSQELE